MTEEQQPPKRIQRWLILPETMIDMISHQGDENQKHRWYHFTLVRWLWSGKWKLKTGWWGCGKIGNFHAAWTMWDYAAATENRPPFPQKCTDEITIWSSIPCLDVFRRLENCSSNQNLDINVHNSIVHSSQMVEAASVSINRRWIHTVYPSTH